MMKIRFFFTVLAIIFASNLFAQLESQRNYFVGGALSYYQYNQNSPIQDNISARIWKNVSYSISPSLGFKLNEKSALGVRINYFKQEAKEQIINDGIETTEEITFFMSNFSAGAFYRKYIPIKNKFNLILELDASYIKTKDVSLTFNGDDIIYNGVNIGLHFVPSLQVSDRWNLLLYLWDIDYTATSKKRNSVDEAIENEVLSFDLKLSEIRFGAEWSF